MNDGRRLKKCGWGLERFGGRKRGRGKVGELMKVQNMSKGEKSVISQQNVVVYEIN